ncbi:MAG TPA: hypothetical protein VK735_37390 [Pseudonocardia sp.]|uniref:hypothetical protein n=1 Tax=Pseudonocardia sp. TaxID=60912 RepID=UPI002C7D9D5C|nr:hypothetical protein [Pseudonocardia sp.]HTF53153.1 hypothetical protein [Pseudonocardia sp.]
MAYPSKEDYLKAVQHSDSFTSDALRRAEFVPHPVWGIPKPAAGTSAVVFKAVLDGQEQALRFLTRQDAALRERYDALGEHFAGHDLVDCVAMSHWEEDAIRIGGRTWPVVRMQWVNGRALNQHVDKLVERLDTAALGVLAADWQRLVARLQAGRFAHGDLQHGNVLVDERGMLRLVDFDCAWIARFTGQTPPTETGHRNYQPENRRWGQWMDTFSGLVVYLSLLTLSRNPTPWHALNTGENLLFQRDDFAPPFRTPAWVHISSILDPQLDQLAACLQRCCAPGWTATGGLAELLAPTPLPWWQLTGTPPAAATPENRELRPAEPAIPPGVPRAPAPTSPKPPAGPWWEAVPTPTPPPRRRSGFRAGCGTLAIGVFALGLAQGAGSGPTLALFAGLLVAAAFLLIYLIRR